MLSLIVVLPLLGAITNGLLNRRASRLVAGGIGTSVLVVAAVLSFVNLYQVMGIHEGGEYPVERLWTWMSTGSMTVDIALRADPLSAVMMCVVTGMPANDQHMPDTHRLLSDHACSTKSNDHQGKRTIYQRAYGHDIWPTKFRVQKPLIHPCGATPCGVDLPGSVISVLSMSSPTF